MMLIGLILFDCMLFILQCCEDELVALVLPSQLLACNYEANSNGLQLCHKGIFIFKNNTDDN